MLEVKVVAGSLVTLVASAALAIVVAVQENPAVIDGLPPWLQFILITVLPPVAAFLGGFLKPSATSTTSDGFKGSSDLRQL